MSYQPPPSPQKPSFFTRVAGVKRKRSLVGDYHGELSLLNVDDFSNVNETRIYWVVIGVDTLTFHVQWIKKKNISVVKNIRLWCSGKLLRKQANKSIISMRPWLSKLDRQLLLFLICGTFAVTVFTLCVVPGVFAGWKWKFWSGRCKLSFLSPPPPPPCFRISSHTPLMHQLFTISPKCRACPQAIPWIEVPL